MYGFESHTLRDFKGPVNSRKMLKNLEFTGFFDAMKPGKIHLRKQKIRPFVIRKLQKNYKLRAAVIALPAAFLLMAWRYTLRMTLPVLHPPAARMSASLTPCA